MPKTPEREAISGGVAGAQYDPCYRLACDSRYDDDPERDADVYVEVNAEFELVGNVNLDALASNADAMAFAVRSLAYSTETVNGVPGKIVPGSPALQLPTEPAGAQGTVGSGGGHSHGLAHDGHSQAIRGASERGGGRSGVRWQAGDEHRRGRGPPPCSQTTTVGTSTVFVGCAVVSVTSSRCPGGGIVARRLLPVDVDGPGEGSRGRHVRREGNGRSGRDLRGGRDRRL